MMIDRDDAADIADAPLDDIDDVLPADELVITIGDASPADDADDERQGTQLVRTLRNQNREQAKELARLRAQTIAPPVAVVDPGPKPSLAAHEYDEEAYEAALDRWKDANAKASEAKTAAQREQEAVQTEWAEDVARLQAARAKLGVADYQDAEDEVAASLSQRQQTVLVQAAKNAPLVVLALARHPAKRAELAKIGNVSKFAAAIAELEGSLRVNKSTKPPAPEGVVRGTASAAPGKDKHLERLERDAERTGNRTAVIAYKVEQRKKASAA